MFVLTTVTLTVFGAAPPLPEPTTTSLIHTLAGHTSTVRGAAFSPDGRTLVTVCEGGILNLYNASTGKVLATTKTGALSSVDYSSDGKHLVTIGSDRVVRLFDAKTAKVLKTFNGHSSAGYVARFTPDGKYIVSGAIDTVARIWEVESGKQIRTLNSGTCYGLAVSPDGKHAITSGGTQDLKLWNIASGDKLRELTGHTSTVVWLEFSPDGRMVGSCAYDSTVRLWETRTGKERLRIAAFTNSPRAVVFTPNCRFVAVTAYDGTTRMFDTISAKEVFLDRSVAGQGFALAFSPDGRWLCAGGQNGKLFLWNVAAITRKKPTSTEMPATTFDGHWNDLGADDAGAAYKSLVAVSSPEALKHFPKRLQPPKPLTEESKKRTSQLLKDLSADEDDKWRKASDELAGFGSAILPTLKAALEKETDADAKLRLVVTIRRADVTGSEELRLLRAVEALERVGSSDAVKLLQNLAQGVRGESITAEAKASLARLARMAR